MPARRDDRSVTTGRRAASMLVGSIGGRRVLARSGSNAALDSRATAAAWGSPVVRRGVQPGWRLRSAASADRPFLERMLCATANWDPAPPFRSLADVLGDPSSAGYL